MDEDCLDSKKGKDFYHNEEYVSFNRFKKFGEQDIKRLQAGFSQSIVFGISGNNNFDVLDLYKNYNIFLNNLKILERFYDEQKHSLVESLYLEWKQDDIYFKKDKDNAMRKMDDIEKAMHWEKSKSLERVPINI